jgi:hypothetical protein
MNPRLLPLVAGLCGSTLATAAAAEVLAPEVMQAVQRERVPLEAVSVLVLGRAPARMKKAGARPAFRCADGAYWLAGIQPKSFSLAIT